MKMSCLCLCTLNIYLAQLFLCPSAFNINVDGVSEHVFIQATKQTFGTPSVTHEGESFFGYKIFMELLNNGIEDTIQLAIGAPSEMTRAYKNSDTEEGGPIKEPNPQSRASIFPTEAMGSMYYCDITLQQLMNQSADKLHPCTLKAGTDRDLTGYDISERDGLGMTLKTSPLSEGGFFIPEKNTIVTCAPLRQHDCTTNHKAEGACYISELTAGRGDSQKVVKWHKRIPCRDSCFERDIDLMFVIDGSYSVGNESFTTVKEWVKEVSNGFDIEDQVQIGVVQYSYFYPNRDHVQQYMKTEISLGQFKDKQLFDEAVDLIAYHGYSTYTAHAINKTVKEDFMGTTSRYPTARRVMILLTDGFADDALELPGAIKFAAASGVESYAVGVANYQREQLELIAGSKENVITVDGFEDLSNIVSQLRRGIQVMEGAAVANASNELTQCQAGISAQFDQSGTLYLGAVGAYDWSGTVIKYDSFDDETPDIPDFEQVANVLKDWTKESYLGYSLTSGFYSGKDESEFIAIGAPRYQLKGAVVIYRSIPGNPNFTDAVTIFPNDENKQLGSYFGGSLLSMDLNSDGRDDLLIGAPLYIEDSYDDGRVYVFIAPQTGKSPQVWVSKPTEENFKILSPGAAAHGSRFGTSMASAGDLNNDGYNDVIIGAPYENNNKGAIFVYFGRAEGIDVRIRQIIHAADLSKFELQYFGFSLYGGQDLDGNGYPDLAVGAPKSDSVVIFRSRPVVTFHGSLKFNEDRLNVFECFAKVDRDCLVLTSCLTLTGNNVEPNINVNFAIDLDSGVSGKDKKRVEFYDESSGFGINVIKGSQNFRTGVEKCWSNVVYAKKTISDYSAPIEATFTYKLSESHRKIFLSSVRDPMAPNQVQATTTFARNCGGDGTCDYDLGVEASLQLPTTFLIGKDITEDGTVLIIAQDTASTPIRVQVNLTNAGENAFDVRVVVNFTAQLSWNNLGNIISSNEKSSLPCIDDAQRDDSDGMTRTKVFNYRFDQNQGNILPEDNWCYFEFNLSTTSLNTNGVLPEMTVSVVAATGNEGSITDDTNKHNNQWVREFPIRYRADAWAQEKSPETTVPFNFTSENMTISSAKEIGLNTSDIQIVYTVDGRGYSIIPKSSLSLSFPFRLPHSTSKDMRHLLYLYKYSCESLDGNAICNCNESVVNPYKLSESYWTENSTNRVNLTLHPNTNLIDKSVVYDCSDNGKEGEDVCGTLRCLVSGLTATDSVMFRVAFRLWTPTLYLSNKTEVILRSGFRFSTRDSPLLINEKGDNVTVFVSSTNTIARLYVPPEVLVSTNNVWRYIVATLIGILLFVVIVFILYKTGFFKSKYAEKKEQLEWTDANDGGGNNVEDTASTADIVSS